MKLQSHDSKPVVKLLMSIAVMMAVTFFTSIAVAIVTLSYPGINANSTAMLVLQFFSSLMMFGVSALICAYMFDRDYRLYFNFNIPSRLGIWAMVLPFASIPLISVLQQWNNGLHFAGEEIFRQIQASAEASTEALIMTDSFTGLLFRLFVIAVTPAVVEEMFFRGVIQTTCIKLCRNTLVGIVISSAFFSFIHFELFSFLPRFVMSIVVGYLFVWSKTLWVPMIYHFLNNAAACVAYYIYGADSSSATEDMPVMLVILSVVIILAFFASEIMRRRKEKQSV